MKANFKINDEFRLKKAETFTRTFPHNRNPDGAVGEADRARVRAGEVAKIFDIHESQVESIEPRYALAFTGRDEELKVHLKESEMLELFEPLV